LLDREDRCLPRACAEFRRHPLDHIRNGLPDGRVVERSVVGSLGSEAEGRSSLGRCLARARGREVDQAGPYVDEPEVDLCKGDLAFAGGREARLPDGFAAEFRQRADDQRVDSHQIELGRGERAFRLKAGNVGALEDEVGARLGQRLAQKIGGLLAQGIVEAVPQQRLAVCGFVRDAPQRDLALQHGRRRCRLGHRTLSLGLGRQAVARFLGRDGRCLYCATCQADRQQQCTKRCGPL
jgi:hypothetical protein